MTATGECSLKDTCFEPSGDTRVDRTSPQPAASAVRAPVDNEPKKLLVLITFGLHFSFVCCRDEEAGTTFYRNPATQVLKT
jgi:hypothetical protein